MHTEIDSIAVQADLYDESAITRAWLNFGRLVMLCCVVLLVGCAAPKYNYFPHELEISEPLLNNVSTAYVGDSMVHQGKYVESDAIFMRSDTVIGLLAVYTFTRGYYLKKGSDQESEFYLPEGGSESGRVIESPIADPFQVIRLDKKSGDLCGVTTFNLEACTDKHDYERKKYPIASHDSFQQILIYSGRIGDKVNIGYREFSNNVARPAFSNDVEYDINDSNIIGYKGCQIEIIEANNQYIKYKVIKNFNRAVI